MSIWPEPEGKKKIPEGHYSFRLNQEPEFIKFPYENKKGEKKEGVKIVLYAIGLNEGGEFQVMDKIPAWDQRYADLCAALGVEHGKEIAMAGSRFEADIIHELDRKDPTKSWPRIINIKPKDEGGDDLPF